MLILKILLTQLHSHLSHFFFTTHQKEKVFRLSNKAEIKEKIKVFNLIYNIGKLLN